MTSSPATFSFASPYAASFSELLAGSGDAAVEERSRASRGYGERGGGIPKFKTLPPPSLPLSPPPVSPSSFFSIPAGLSPAEFLDSPVLLSSNNILHSPTTGTFPPKHLSWRGNSDSYDYFENKDNEGRPYSNFSFQSRSKPSSLQQQLALSKGSQPWSYQEPSIKTENSAPVIQASDTIKEPKNSDDGYNWRKYGQKQVKGSENPRSYYKCTFPNCPTKKKVEKNFEGQITEIIYRGAHNHPKPQSTRRNSASSQSIQPHAASAVASEASEHSYAGRSETPMESVTTPDNSSVSFGEDEVNMSSQRSNLAGEDFREEEPQAKRWKKEGENEGVAAAGNKTVREPRVVVQTTSDIDILDDGFRWRKYGQKVVKGNPNPRSYYKCTTVGCPVRKHIERACNDLRSVITTYEGKHNHDVPAARGSAGHSSTQPQLLENARPVVTVVRPLSSIVTNSLLEQRNHGSYTSFSELENRSNTNAYMSQHAHHQMREMENLFPKAKEEPGDDLLLDSF